MLLADLVPTVARILVQSLMIRADVNGRPQKQFPEILLATASGLVIADVKAAQFTDVNVVMVLNSYAGEEGLVVVGSDEAGGD